MLHSNFIIIGTLIAAAGSVKYLIETVNGRVKPNRVTFLLWSVIPFIAFFAQIEQGVGLEALMTFSSGFLPLSAVPTIVKSYRYPRTEIVWPWIATVIGVVLTLLTLPEFTFAICGFIVYILAVNTLIYVLVQFRPGEKFRSKTIDSNK